MLAAASRLVIDDLHELTSPEALAQLTRLLTNLPPQVHAILATRHDVRLGLHQLRLAGELAEIRGADLRFSERETRELLDASGIALSAAGAALLHQRTEGWAAGLRLAAISLAGHPDPERFVTEFSGSDRTVAEYLLAEMLERQPPDVQDLLLRTSLLDRVNGELADLLTGRPGSEQILLSLEDANAFVESLDPERTWFRYHHLFADLLRLELRRRLPDEVPTLHRRAAEWFTLQGQMVEAIGHTQAAGDWPEAARLLADYSFSMTLDGQAQTMQALVRAFPPGGDHPELALVRAEGDLAPGTPGRGGRPPGGRRDVRRDGAARSPAPPPGGDRVAASCRWPGGAVTWPASSSRSDSSPPRSPGRPTRTSRSAATCARWRLLNLGTAEAWSLGLPDAERHLREGADLARQIGRPYLEVGCLAQLGFASIFHSAAMPKADAFATTQRCCREAIALAERYGWGTEPVIAPALMTLAGTMVWLGEFDEGERWLRRTERALQTDTGPDIRLLLHQTAGMLHAGRGRHHEALEEFGAAEHLASQLEGSQALASQVTGWLLATQARAGLPGEARALLAALDDERASSGEIRNARAVICLADGDPAASPGRVADVLDGTAPVLGYTTVTEAHLLAGLAHRQLGDQRAASQAAERALALAESDRLVLPFAMTGSAGAARGAAPAPDRARRAARRHPRRPAQLIPGGQRAVLVAAGGGAQPGRAQGAAISADQPVPARDRRRTVGLAEHRQHAPAQHLRQAPGS